MKIRLFCISLIISVIFLAGCASTPDLPVPAWLSDSESVYPKSDFLFQMGEGVSAAEAKNNAQGELAAYLNTNIQRVVETNLKMVTGAESSAEKQRSINSTVVASTDLDIFAMETTEVYYYKATKKWYCGAYINRKTAFEQREPAVRDNAEKFYSVYNLAEKTTDPMKKIKIYSNAKKAAEPFIDDLYTLIMFSKDLTETRFGKDRKVVAGIEGLIQDEKNNCVIYVDVPVDSSKKVSSVVKKVFANNGFIVTEKKQESHYVAEVDVDFNMETEGSGDDTLYVAFPSVKISLRGWEGYIYTYEAKIKKNMSYYKSKVESAACENIASKLQEEFEADFVAQMGNN